MNPRLLHYSKLPLTKVHSEPLGKPGTGRFKPAGLWVSVEGPDDWEYWCLSEGFEPERLACVQEIRLTLDAKILRLSSPDGIDQFTERYRRWLEPGIFWENVGLSYDGIIIAPYCWERRLTDHTFWYYGWDCASGCIWNASAISEIIPLTRVATAWHAAYSAENPGKE